MKLQYLLSCFSIFTPLIHGRPEAPYFYSAPSAVENAFSRSAPLQSQSYLPAIRNTEQWQPSFNNIPATSYGTPILMSPNIALSNPTLPQKNYGSPDVMFHQPPRSPYSAQPERAVSIRKHIYVHVAPPDMESEIPQRIQQPTVTQKHYKIIFVKVPSYSPTAQYIAQQQAPQEEKTLIYVLVKKPEDAVEVKANQVTNAPINRPEVYFVKYKAKAEQPLPVPTAGQTESVQNEDNDSVVVESASRTSQPQSQGYRYDKPGSVLK